ncbi:MAG: hydrogenase subunit EhbG [Candidatus Methanofastidiosum methylothiophilum]|uniref:Hydrogenase subunit EhbG n=1 Tax=Candidatus Methanofastidiosum methylothiophilum TaxID=1705564 RepID=A0A150IU89_9EURY|nr:MAG: hydrogenase subunit EhbG [Candidatus Methanofastidiosum methylthiophilus]KYC48557.1 MAG: hydrogenase subunit EhbG [Candidatus Methanofastidiosum methylthiophilus]KYC51273.1 MAG: hydrogenase subunit EhbG [Candidatus Methanofastidiosum methylthiophilus]
MLDRVYEIFHEKMKDKGQGMGIGSALTSEFLMLSFLLIGTILVLRTANSTILGFGALIILAGVLFTVPTVFKVEKENTDSINLSSFYVALTLALLLIIFLGGI